MNRVLRGEPLAPLDVLLPLAVAAVLTALSLAYIAGRLRAAAARP